VQIKTVLSDYLLECKVISTARRVTTPTSEPFVLLIIGHVFVFVFGYFLLGCARWETKGWNFYGLLKQPAHGGRNQFGV
jgi:hypothetical protein